MTRRVLVLSTLYPNPAQPSFGGFVARSMEALAALGQWDVTVVNPIGAPPLALGRYAGLARAAVAGCEAGVAVHRPRFALVPRLSARWNPSLGRNALMILVDPIEAIHRYIGKCGDTEETVNSSLDLGPDQARLMLTMRF